MEQNTAPIGELPAIKMKTFLLLLLVLTNLSLSGQVPNKDTTNHIKKLNIVLVTGSSIVLQDGMINTENSKSFMTFYNDNGKPIEERIANIKDRSGIIYKYYYGACNDFQKWEWLQFKDDKIDTVQIQQITFDSNCRIDKIVWTDSTGSITNVRYLEIDATGRQLKEIDKDRKEKVTSFVNYSYPDRFITDKKAFFGDSTFWYHSQEFFDRKGNRMKSISFDDKGKKSTEDEKAEYIYIGDKLIEEITYNLEGKISSKTTYHYNVDNLVDRIVTKVVNTNEDTETITNYKYHKRN